MSDSMVSMDIGRERDNSSDRARRWDISCMGTSSSICFSSTKGVFSKSAMVCAALEVMRDGLGMAVPREVVRCRLVIERTVRRVGNGVFSLLSPTTLYRLRNVCDWCDSQQVSDRHKSESRQRLVALRGGQVPRVGGR